MAITGVAPRISLPLCVRSPNLQVHRPPTLLTFSWLLRNQYSMVCWSGSDFSCLQLNNRPGFIRGNTVAPASFSGDRGWILPSERDLRSLQAKYCLLKCTETFLRRINANCFHSRTSGGQYPPEAKTRVSINFAPPE